MRGGAGEISGPALRFPGPAEMTTSAGPAISAAGGAPGTFLMAMGIAADVSGNCRVAD